MTYIRFWRVKTKAEQKGEKVVTSTLMLLLQAILN
jgi:hypothetical protein